MTFHEVRDSKDKWAVVMEALRVLRKGGCFAFQDLFLLRSIYPDTTVMTESLEKLGFSNVHFINTSNSPSIPRALKLPFMVGRIGILHGRK